MNRGTPAATAASNSCSCLPTIAGSKPLRAETTHDVPRMRAVARPRRRNRPRSTSRGQLQGGYAVSCCGLPNECTIRDVSAPEGRCDAPAKIARAPGKQHWPGAYRSHAAKKMKLNGAVQFIRVRVRPEGSKNNDFVKKDRRDSKKSQKSRGGRPTRERAPEVEARILDAATSLFLTRGFDATSYDQVVALAHAGKASLYARYPNKEALFSSVVRRNVDRALAPAGHVDPTTPLRERLTAVGHSILEHSLAPKAIALIRIIIAEAPRMPELAQHVDRIGWEAGVRRVAEAICARGADDAATLSAAWPAAARFIELVFVPTQMRALLGDSPETLTVDAARRIEQAIDTLIAARLLDAWR